MQVDRKNLLLYAGVAAVVIIAIGWLLFHGTLTTSALYNQTVSGGQLAMLRSIANNQTLASDVGIGAYIGLGSSTYIKQITDTPLMANGKPELLLISAEFCPYCAASRWAMVLALMRFGNLTGIRYSESSPTDVYPNTPTFTYLNVSYTSSYLTLKPFETETRTSQPLQTLDNTSQALYYKYGNAIPFTDFGNEYIDSGSLISPGIYQNLDWSTIISQLPQTNTQISQEVIGAANIYTAEICAMINNTAPVCSQNYVKVARNKFLA